MRFASRVGFICVAVITAVGLGAMPAQAAPHHHTIWVHPGTGTISAAVASAQPGDTIWLGKGTFYDSVFIPITLTIRGSGWHKTVVKPPASSDNPCNDPEGVNGFCAAGAFDDQGNPDVSHPVRNVTIEDLRVTGFSATGVLGFNTRGMFVRGVRADHDGGYGIARFVSTKSVFEHNWTSYNEEAGLYMGDSPNGDSVVRNNWTDHNGFGVFLRDSTELTARGNKAWGNCIGILALDTGEPTAAGAYTIVGNKVFANDRVCPASEDGPPVSGIGIALAGVHDTLVKDNDVNFNKPGGDSIISGGIVLFSTAPDGADPTDNTVRNNELHHNRQADIVSDGTGSGNVIKQNECRTTIPADLGGCDH
jgi:nitrous oxidase accessory protein NosD